MLRVVLVHLLIWKYFRRRKRKANNLFSYSSDPKVGGVKPSIAVSNAVAIHLVLCYKVSNFIPIFFLYFSIHLILSHFLIKLSCLFPFYSPVGLLHLFLGFLYCFIKSCWNKLNISPCFTFQILWISRCFFLRCYNFPPNLCSMCFFPLFMCLSFFQNVLSIFSIFYLHLFLS